MGEFLRVLIVEDSEDDALLLVRALEQEGFDLDYRLVDSAETVAAALDVPWDIVVADYSMPQFCGVEVLRLLQERGLDTPFILVSGTIGEEMAVDAMRAGAHDYIMKNHLSLVPQAVKREIQEATIRRQHRRAEERFRVVSQVATDIIYEWDLATDRLEWFGAFDESLGYAQGDIPHTIEGWLTQVHPEDRPRCQALVARRREATFSVYEHYRIVTKHGTLRYWLDRGAPIVDRSGVPVRWVGGCSDVTETKDAERQLRDYQQRLRSLASQLSLAEERERRRVAEGLHDNIGQRLALTKLDLQSLQQTLDDVGTIRQLERICRSLDTIMEETHSLTFDLSNPVLYEVGLDAAVESWLARTIEGKYGLTLTFSATLDGLPLEETVRVFLFQCIRELVTNVVKHAEAEHLSVCLNRVGSGLAVRIEDDGIGFDPEAKELSGSGGFGLFSVRERLEYLGGGLEIDSARGRGTRVTLRAPGAHASTP